jgi:hypothetical protein
VKHMFLAALAAVSLSACTPSTVTTSPSDLPVVSTVCEQIRSDKFDIALKAYGAAVDAVNLLIDAKVLVPSTPRALAVAKANDRVLAAFAVAERARRACNSGSYLAAMNEVSAAIAEIRIALKS